MIALASTLLVAVALMALVLPTTWRILASLLLQAAEHAGAVAMFLETTPARYRKMLARSRELTGAKV